LEPADPIDKVTIIPRGQALGATLSLPERDRYGFGREYLLATMRVLCGGRIAEHRKTGDVSSGAADDISKLTKLAKKMVREWGMSDELGFLQYHEDEHEQRLVAAREYSENTAREIDEEIRRLVDQAYCDAEQRLLDQWDQVVQIAEGLLEHETLSAEDVMRILGKQPDDDRQGEPQTDNPVAV
jgi:cell division protease FtsH